jgi:polar amino acid transport system substrate-binding protein
MRKATPLSLGLIAILTAACSSAGASASPAPSAATAAPAASTAVVSLAPTVAPSATPDPCAVANLTLLNKGKLTIGTDNPAYPPYFAENADKSKTAPWEGGDPTNGNGFESAVAYAIADRMGFAKTDVTWVVVPFLNSYAPGPKAFDMDLNQVSYNAERANTADLSKGYYFGNQALVVLKDSPLAKATSIAQLKDYVYGAQVGTTSYAAIGALIAPSKEARVYDTNDLAIKALAKKTIDGVVVDLPTADFITNVQVQNAVIVGQFNGGTPEYFSAVLAKGSPLTACVNVAIDSLTADGTLTKLASKWLPFQDAVPFIKP